MDAVPFQSGKIIFLGRGSKRRLNPSLSEIRVSTTFRSDMPSESEGDDQNTYVARQFTEGETNTAMIETTIYGLPTDTLGVYLKCSSDL